MRSRRASPQETQNRGRNSGATSSVFSATDTVFKLAFSISHPGTPGTVTHMRTIARPCIWSGNALCCAGFWRHPECLDNRKPFVMKMYPWIGGTRMSCSTRHRRTDKGLPARQARRHLQAALAWQGKFPGRKHLETLEKWFRDRINFARLVTPQTRTLSFIAIFTESASDRAFIFRITWPRCAFTVISLIPSWKPTCLFSRPERRTPLLPLATTREGVTIKQRPHFASDRASPGCTQSPARWHSPPSHRKMAW